MRRSVRGPGKGRESMPFRPPPYAPRKEEGDTCGPSRTPTPLRVAHHLHANPAMPPPARRLPIKLLLHLITPRRHGFPPHRYFAPLPALPALRLIFSPRYMTPLPL